MVDGVRDFVRRDGQVFESMNMWGHEKDRVLDVGIVKEIFFVDTQGGNF